MTRPVSFTPTDRTGCGDAAGPVRRRRVLYVPGYDPDAESRSRMLFVREAIRYAKRFGLTERRIGRSRPLDGPLGFRWEVEAGTGAWRTDTSMEVLRWDDIVARDFRRPLPVAMALLFVALAYSIVTGVLPALFRLSWKFGGVILYPPVMVVAALALAGGAGWGVGAAAVWAGLPWPAAACLGLAVAAGVLRLLKPLGHRWFVWHLMYDWLFNWQHGCGMRPDYEKRVEVFAGYLAAAVAAGDADEVLVVGHSSGAPMAAEMVGEALARHPGLGSGGTAVSLLTLGSCLPLVAVNPLARTCRTRLARLIGAPGITWVEYQAPQDWLNFSGFNPLRDIRSLRGVHPRYNPIVRSTKFREIVHPATYEKILYRPFRMHFQFLMANDRAGEYDYLLMLLGPRTLCDRVLAGRGADDISAADVTSDQASAAEKDRTAYEARDVH